MFAGKVFQTLWARRAIVLTALIGTLIGAVVVWKTLPPRYAATARVMLEVVKPDPVTGQVLNKDTAAIYVRTQIEMIRDYDVAGRVVDELGWLQNPEFQAAYDTRKDGGDMDIRRWAAAPIMAATAANLQPESNVLEITFRSTVPQNAQAVADSLRRAYINATIERRRAAAQATADWYDAQSVKTQAALARLEQTKTELQHKTGIVLQARGRDLASEMLSNVASITSRPMPAIENRPMRATENLAQADYEISQLSRTLGPNHPALLAAQRRRAGLVAAAQEEGNFQRESASRADASARALINQLGSLTATVVSQRGALAQMQRLQDEIDLLRLQYDSETGRSAKLRQDADATAVGITPIGATSFPVSPEFPNPPLILGGALVLGSGVGVMLALLTELLGRKVRSAGDLESATRTPVLASVPPPPRRPRARKVRTPKAVRPKPARAPKLEAARKAAGGAL
ncbi:MAG: hypothetical protein KKE02_17285 [Alphaproteobacteria bacterium]|nr:hypothetical protein [Alphaproteobacteria bacterium]MBU1512954.1 hypothetical protein [Alphaproteobacteria bacterium]MBU2094872.1 hypothetical protein [Alphaproteobacteria bacterium]MBU2152778.1 hypothetical protein [Alphaproteobacteria bacterium]MBU2306313.1 hypothetical protein [Alphaproteobacteria bacterium]